mgnify:CR=1 FL=1
MKLKLDIILSTFNEKPLWGLVIKDLHICIISVDVSAMKYNIHCLLNSLY